MKHLTIISLFFALFSTVWGAEIVKGPYTEDVEQKSAIVKFVATETTPAWLEYGPMGKCNQLMAISAPSRMHRLFCMGLHQIHNSAIKLM